VTKNLRIVAWNKTYLSTLSLNPESMLTRWHLPVEKLIRFMAEKRG